MLVTLCLLTCLILITTLWGRYHDYPYFTSEVVLWTAQLVWGGARLVQGERGGMDTSRVGCLTTAVDACWEEPLDLIPCLKHPAPGQEPGRPEVIGDQSYCWQTWCIPPFKQDWSPLRWDTRGARLDITQVWVPGACERASHILLYISVSLASSCLSAALLWRKPHVAQPTPPQAACVRWTS